ncbi:MAG: hypothetical protein JXD21_00065 [Candidatus Omnitrophica bacterium]|nr:hypothetical protein [Candidatus Omnitrophota bacterium]
MKKTRSQQFIELFRYWCGRLKLDKNIPVIKDNRYDCYACVEHSRRHQKKVLKYNTKKLARWNEAFLVCGVFHEIAHLKEKMPYRTNQEKIACESRAERFALNMLKKHYPKLYRENIRYGKDSLRDTRWHKNDQLNYAVLKRIREYNPKIK